MPNTKAYELMYTTLLTANVNAVQFHSFDWSMCLLNEIL